MKCKRASLLFNLPLYSTRHTPRKFFYVDAYFCVFLPATVGNVVVRVTANTACSRAALRP